MFIFQKSGDRSQKVEFCLFYVFRHGLTQIKGVVVFITKSTMIFCDGLVIVFLHSDGVPDQVSIIPQNRPKGKGKGLTMGEGEELGMKN